MIHVFIGTKAQLIKMAPILKTLENEKIKYNFIFTGQHQATIANIREDFDIKEPDIYLYKGRDITGIFQMFWWSLKIVFYVTFNSEKIWGKEKGGVVLNHGDTFTTLLGTILAKFSGKKTAHVESGLRSYNLLHPFPEELIRRATFLLSDIYYAPGKWAIENLRSFNGEKVDTSNNTLLDSLKASKEKIEKVKIGIPEYKYGVVSVHRFENIFSEAKLNRIVECLNLVSKTHRIVFVLHLPTLKKLESYKLLNKLKSMENIELRPRYSYFQFIKLIRYSQFVITDGGSNQEECYYLGKPCLILRNATERNEGLGKNALLSQYKGSKINHFINNIDSYKYPEMLDENSPSQLIVSHLKKMNYKLSAKH